jgi:leucine-zipper of insertion element IS481
VLALPDGAAVTEVSAEVGVLRQALHAWVRRCRAPGLAGLALARYEAPEEVLSDNGIQFTARFARGGEVLRRELLDDARPFTSLLEAQAPVKPSCTVAGLPPSPPRQAAVGSRPGAGTFSKRRTKRSSPTFPTASGVSASGSSA